MRILTETTPHAYEIFLSRKTNGSKPWHEFYHYPAYGVSYMFFNLGSPTYLGYAHSIFPFLQFHLTKPENRVCLNLRLAAGAGRIDKIYDPVKNFKNASISTHFNAFLGMGLEGSVRITPPLNLTGGLSYSHFSNGTIKKPNTGLNYVTASVGASYSFFGENKIISEITASDQKWHYTIILSGGMKSYIIFEDVNFAAAGLSFEVSRKHLTFTRISGTVDVFYDALDYALLARRGENATRFQTVKLGAAAGYSFLFGNLSANVQLGRYLIAKKHDAGMYYQRVVLRYRISDRISFHAGLKTHFGTADYIEFAIGYRL
jgi:hypothetical protein